ncbi:MAG: energy transducer TonB [Acidobacteriota bacterium]|nr:energy transducer TonB [Acidobacteriota bacterium]
MTSPTTYDQLDNAITLMLAEPETALPTLDAEASGLLELAAELRSLPRPEFHAALENDLRYALGLPLRPKLPPIVRRPAAQIAPEQALPTLFGAGPATYPVRQRNFALSMAVHAAMIALVLGSTMFVAKVSSTKHQNVTALVSPELSEYNLPISDGKAGGGGGGGDRDKLDASAGRLPKASLSQVTPPSAVIRNPNPALAVEPTVVMPNINVPQPNLAALGDPLARLDRPPSNGTGSGGGIGSGDGGGVGSGRGPGVGPGWGGGIGGGAYRVGGGVSAPRAIYAPDPDYSEEARKAKYQGSVVLWLIVGPDGRPRDVKVVRSLGMGLDEKAVEAVRTWKFEPALKDGRAVPVQVNIEVSFRLY